MICYYHRQYVDPSFEGMAEHLAVGMNPYNYVYLCTFCAQYMEPDAPGGIIFPDITRDRSSASANSSSRPHTQSGAHNGTSTNATSTSTTAPNKGGASSVTFFDDRYPDTMRLEDPKAAEDARQFKQFMSETRTRARVAMDIARAVREARAISARRQAEMEVVDAQIAAGFGNIVARSTSPVKFERERVISDSNAK